MRPLRLSPDCLPTRIPLNTVLWWFIAVEVYEMPEWFEITGWALLGFILIALYGTSRLEQRVDIFESYRERQAKNDDKTER